MARLVSPWTWNKKLRDFGPDDRDFILAMLILYTFMNRQGSVFVGLRAWAKAARMAVNTLRKHLATAVNEGWLHVEAEGGPAAQRFKNLYRCTVPQHIELSDKDVELAGRIESECGELDESVSTHIDTDTPPSLQSVSSHIDTDLEHADPRSSSSSTLDMTAEPSVSNLTPASADLCQGESNLCHQEGDLYQTDSQSVSPMLIRKGSPLEGYSEALKEVSSEEGAARSSTVSRERILGDIDSNPFKSPLTESRKTRNQDFETINNKIEKLAVLKSLGGSELDLSDTNSIALLTGCSHAQVVMSIRQLRDRGRLPVKTKQRATA